MEISSKPLRHSGFSSLLEQIAWRCRFAAVAWVAVFTVLFCAVAPAGLPHTASHGSAFNPATTSVALQAKAPQGRLLIKRLLNRDTGDIPLERAVAQPLAILAAAATPSIFGKTAERVVPPAAVAVWVASPAHALPWARGPPAA